MIRKNRMFKILYLNNRETHHPVIKVTDSGIRNLLDLYLDDMAGSIFLAYSNFVIQRRTKDIK